ncbi:phosphomannose isomerase type II C-terminal cupin domain [Thermomonospora cellulosilytica]|uniref:Mannose-1-phosphate guanylyltransferase/mannose-6-phosphate isomerase n=1 Tax=Thermomonospora cellulosilytica TaxID=1411118 RepID=A0A7W3RCI2_9ACTN|nr:phosphomannose isomerase type II C-terminal cupin domain [Thermomonospora cellulosilytica]MBA9007951.1 mannose-1-phosphate guanylyltransferase/mannose-6-phosphate isomerase [Thermomonospora cellulosilytica]
MTSPTSRIDEPEIYTEQRPWGGFERFTWNEQSTVKIIHVAPGQRLSLQRHRHRDELWVALDPGAVFEVAGERIEPEVGRRVMIRAGQTHRMSSSGPAVRVLEIAFGHFDEDDIERLEDSYGRV